MEAQGFLGLLGAFHQFAREQGGVFDARGVGPQVELERESEEGAVSSFPGQRGEIISLCVFGQCTPERSRGSRGRAARSSVVVEIVGKAEMRFRVNCLTGTGGVPD
ncbi:hypothetical protein FGW37_26045 [Streptomyces rectiverticillatus]|uniref:hypothetical protein n=1 Tax=Streptomyces rectiverticillatus TaxID=173860 RepID=UPI0015C350A0|nr:hypothetical protein [Streptomyces rectiverticillatus]QLE74592.1 hypothetical protein FGW37_26045 [Streptomyces rectiverticillatus]